jgi:large subunit ribosomal protein L4
MKRIRIIILGMLIMSGCAHARGPLRDGSCPPDFPIKGNADSFIYHTPASLFYGRTRAEVCFNLEEAAFRHGYRPSRY